MDPILPIGRNNPDVAAVQPVERHALRREEERGQQPEQRRRRRRKPPPPDREPGDGSHIDVRA